jgi:flagellar hook-length control protein FliK
MAVATNPLLQTGPSAAASSTVKITAPGGVPKVADGSKDAGSSFAQVYAQEHRAVPTKAAAINTARTSQHLAGPDRKSTPALAAKDGKPSVAGDGKPSPVDKADRSDKTDKAVKADKTAKADTDDTATNNVVSPDDDPEAVLVKASDDDDDSDMASSDPSLTLAVPLADPTAATPPGPAQPTPDPAQPPAPSVDPAQLQAMAPVPPASDTSDPHADALADLPMVRMALEQNAKAQGTTSVHAQASTPVAQANADAATGDTFAQSMSTLLDQQKVTDGAGGSKDSDALGAIGDVKGADTDSTGSRVPDLGSRLDQLSQAVAGKASAAPATPPATPLNMQQSGWSEGVVNRVMYLSSQNLKSADIQLHPLELGRLDIRIDVTPDQTTQVTFHSAHVGVRDALESQQGRLRDLLSQQGLTQVDVSVSDQSRQQQQQQQQQQAQAQAGRGAGSSAGRGDRAAQDTQVSAVADAAATQQVVGSSLVDYYA